jgi:hypothetical protein
MKNFKKRLCFLFIIYFVSNCIANTTKELSLKELIQKHLNSWDKKIETPLDAHVFFHLAPSLLSNLTNRKEELAPPLLLNSNILSSFQQEFSKVYEGQDLEHFKQTVSWIEKEKENLEKSQKDTATTLFNNLEYLEKNSKNQNHKTLVVSLLLEAYFVLFDASLLTKAFSLQSSLPLNSSQSEEFQALDYYNQIRINRIQKNEKNLEILKKSLLSTLSQKTSPRLSPWIIPGLSFIYPKIEISVIGNLEQTNTRKLITQLKNTQNPYIISAAGIYNSEQPLELLKDKPMIQQTHGTIYVCEENICHLPTLDTHKITPYLVWPSI